MYEGGTGGRSVGLWWIAVRILCESGLVADCSRATSSRTEVGDDGLVGGVVVGSGVGYGEGDGDILGVGIVYRI